MARSKPPAFAVCGGVSVETVVTGVGRRRSNGKATKKSAVAGLADSLYADLLWDCGGANVESATAAVGTTSSMQALPKQDFSDVFGGPPKFASISSQLSFRRRPTKVSDACSNGIFLIESPASTTPSLDIIGQTPLCIVQKTLGNSTPTSSPARSVKVRANTEADVSSRICHRKSDHKCSIQHKSDISMSGKDFSSTVPSGAASRVRTASTFVKRKESSRSDVVGDTKSSSLSQLSRKGLAGMKENIEEFIKVPESEQEGKLANVHDKMAHVLKGSQDRKQKLGHNDDPQRQNQFLKIRIESPEEHWVTINDVQCATEPSRFPPPSRPPPELRPDAACVSKNTEETPSRIDDRQNGSGLALPKQSNLDSVSLSSSSTRELNTRATYDSGDIEDAVEIAEAKIKMVLEARKKAKLMVENKLKEKRRAQQLKERSARESKPGAEGEFNRDMEDLKGEKGKSRHRCSKHDVNKLEAEQTRQRDIARHCIEKATQDLQNQSVSSVQGRVAELRFSHNFEEPVEMRKECHTPKVDLNRSTVHTEPTSQSGYFWLETSGRHQKQSSCEERSEKVVEEAITTPSKQQQDPLSSAWCFFEQREFDQFSCLDELDSMLCTPNTAVSLHDKVASLLHGDDVSSTGFQEIMGETPERRVARWDRHCRTAARMAKALEEKKQRDLERQKEQAERHRAAEMLDEEIKIWAAGKEGNLEALLCSLHLVLWPECGWKVASPADLSTIAALKKAYRRATLCVHPDKVQQRGATVTQKYVAEKIFDLLREASAMYN